MGTRSKVDVNCRCTVRGRVNAFDLDEAVQVLEGQQNSNREGRLRARALIRKQANWICGNVAAEDRTSTDRNTLAVARDLANWS